MVCKKGLWQFWNCIEESRTKNGFAVISFILGISLLTLSLLVYLDIIHHIQEHISIDNIFINLIHYAPQSTEAVIVTGVFQAVSSLLFLSHIQPFKSWRWIQLLSSLVSLVCFIIALIDLQVFSKLTPYFNYYVTGLFFNSLFSAVSFGLFRLRDDPDVGVPPSFLLNL